MIHYLLIVALATPCASATVVSKGQQSPCTGLVWSVEETKNALKCKRVDLPKVNAELELCQRTQRVKVNALTARAETAEMLLRVAPQPLPGWVLPTVSTGSLIIGLAAGFFMMGGLQ